MRASIYIIGVNVRSLSLLAMHWRRGSHSRLFARVSLQLFRTLQLHHFRAFSTPSKSDRTSYECSQVSATQPGPPHCAMNVRTPNTISTTPAYSRQHDTNPVPRSTRHKVPDSSDAPGRTVRCRGSRTLVRSPASNEAPQLMRSAGRASEMRGGGAGVPRAI